MKFEYVIEEETGLRNIFWSRVSERFDSELNKHVFSYHHVDDSDQDIFLLSSKEAEPEWLEGVDRNLIDDKQVEQALMQFRCIQEDETIMQLDGEEKLRIELGSYHNIGFRNEFYITVDGISSISGRVWWIVKRQFSTTSSGVQNEPIFAVRYIQPSESGESGIYGEPAIPTDLYINQKGEYRPDELSEVIFEDISDIFICIKNVKVEYRPRC